MRVLQILFFERFPNSHQITATSSVALLHPPIDAQTHMHFNTQNQYVLIFANTHTYISKLRETRKYDGLVPGRSIERNQGQHHPPSGFLIWPNFNYSQISGSSNQFVHKHVQLTWKYGFPSRRKIAIYIENPKSSRLCVYVIFCVLCCFLGVCFEWVFYTICVFCCNICVFMFFVRSCTVLY